MKNQLTLGLALALAMTCGALMTLMLRPEPARAQQNRQWSSCFIADFGGHADGDNEEQMRQARGQIRVPPGWTPIGGNGVANRAFVVLCR